MKIVLAILCVWNVGQSQFKHCEGDLQSVQAFYASVRSPKPYKPLCRTGYARTNMFKRREGRTKPFQPLRSYEICTSFFKCLEGSRKPFQALWRCCTDRTSLFPRR